MPRIRLAIVSTHPVQYYTPWFRQLAARPELDSKVFFLWDFGVRERFDPGFGKTLKWDLPQLEGYAHEFVRNVASRPGTDHFLGIVNPGLSRRLRAFAPDAVLLVGYAYPSMLGVMLSPALRRLPLLLRGDSHHLVPGGRRGWRDAVKLLLLRRFAAMLAVGSANRRWYRDLGVPDSRIFFSPHAVDAARFADASHAAEAARWRAELGIAVDDTVVLFAGKFESKKRPDLLAEAFRALPGERLRLVCAGDGALRPVLESAAVADGRIRVLPFQNQSRMPALYALADLVALPSQGPGETWGLCINEAMSVGRAVLVSDHVGCGPDLVRAGENGWIVPAGDRAALRRTLEDAVSDHSRLRRYGENSARIIRDYSYSAATDGLMQALAACGAGRR